LVVRAGAPGEVLVALQYVAAERRYKFHEAFALTVIVGPVVAFKPASKSVGVGVVSAVEPALICRYTTRPAVIVTLPVLLQVPGAPLAVHGVVCATAAGAHTDIIVAATTAKTVVRLI
jgi:hypothetical protein